MENPHKNIARYLGCVVKAGRITGLCFEKYAETLDDRLQDGRFVDTDSYLRHIKAGIDHLHTLDIVHNDIHLDNVMFADTDGDVPVIIDFDSCAIRGLPLPPKRGQLPKGARTAEFENDDYGLEMLQKEVREFIQKGRFKG
jgi:serine/threonine protein kinase